MQKNNWFEVKCRYEKMMESGMVKMVTEPYLIDAWSFTEAEARGVEEITPYMQGEFELTAVGKKNFAEVINDEGDRYYLVVLEFIALDEKSGNEKKTKARMIASANNVQGALDSVNKFMDDSMVDYSIYSVTETPIVDVFVYKAPEKEEKE